MPNLLFRLVFSDLFVIIVIDTECNRSSKMLDFHLKFRIPKKQDIACKVQM